MNFINVIIILALALGAFLGWKHGFVRQVISVVGLFIIVVLAYFIKNPISKVFYKYLPFIKYDGAFKNVSSINIIIYELIAFAITFSILYTGFKIILNTTSIVGKILKANRFLGKHSSILGSLFGVIEAYLIVFLGLYALSLPIFNVKALGESSMANTILDNTPILSYIIDDKLTLYEEINALKIQYAKSDEHQILDSKILRLLIDNKVVTLDNVNELISEGKIDYKLLEIDSEQDTNQENKKTN